MIKTRWLLLSGLMAVAVGSSSAQSLFTLKEIKPATIETLKAKEAGVMDSVDVGVGDTVSEKQIVAKLEHDRQLHTYNTAKVRAENKSGIEIAEGEFDEKNANLEEMQARLRRRQVSEAQVEQAAGQQKTAKGKLEQAKMFAELAKLEFELAEKMLERRFIRSTMNGTVLDVSKSRGDKANEGEVIVTVADLSEVSAEIPMSKECAASLSSNLNMPVRMANTTVTRLAHVQSVSPLPKGTKGEQLVKVVFDNPNPASNLKQQVYEILLPEGVKALPVAKEQTPAPKPATPAKKAKS